MNEGSAGSPLDNRNRIIAAGFGVICLVALVVSVQPALLSFLVFRTSIIGAALMPGLAIVLGCTGMGYWLVRQSAGSFCRMELLLLSFACGLAPMSCGVAVLGFGGALNQYSALALIGLGLVTGVPLWRSLLRAGSHKDGRERLKSSSLVLLILIGIMAAMLGIFSLTPPLLFDVTEYHLGAWTDYQSVSGGSAKFIAMPHNFYARFPFPIESLYFLGLSVFPSLDSAPKIINAVCILACGVLAVVFVRRCGIARGGQLLAGLGVLTLPVMLDVSVDAMIDAPVALLVAASVYLVLMAGQSFDRETGANPSLVLPAVFLFGSALSVKYTVAQLYLLPWCVIAFPALRKAGRTRPGLLTLSLVLAAIPCCVWFGKNLVLYGNPLEPFFVRWFRPDAKVDILREDFYIRNHFPQSPLGLDYWMSLLPRLRELTWLYLLLCLGWRLRPQKAVLWRVAIFSGLAFLLWNTVRESQDRFLLPVLILVCCLAVVGVCSVPHRRLRQGLAGLVVIFCVSQMTAYALKLKDADGIDYVADFFPGENGVAETDEVTARQKFLEKNLGDLGRMVTDIQKLRRSDAKILLIYEARPYLFPCATEYNVVWDDSVLLNVIGGAATVDEAWQKIKAEGYTHILVNRQELLRYIQQYGEPSMLRRFGVRSGDDPRKAWSFAKTPEVLYPPFYRDERWGNSLIKLVPELLADIDKKATIRHGLTSPGDGVQPLDITVTPTGL